MGWKGSRNKFKYRCTACGATQYLPLGAFDRHTRPSCLNCGHPGLELTHDGAQKRVGAVRAVRDEIRETVKAKMNK